MASPRMIQSQFGSLIYDSGVIPPLSIGPNAATVIFNEVPTVYMAVERHNDKLYVANPLGPNPESGDNFVSTDGLSFATFDYIDLRDLMEEKAGIDDVTINLQRLYEVPFPNLTYNMSPGNIEECVTILLGKHDLSTFEGQNPKFWSKAGFQGLGDTPGTGGTWGGLPFEVLYRELRQYVQDPSQNFLSPDQMGSQSDPSGNPAEAPTRFVGNYRMQSRTIGGYPDLIVGPGITIIRSWTMYPANRDAQTFIGTNPGDAPADEYTYLNSRVQCYVPAMQINIVGTQRPLTATETATYYSNIVNRTR